jgi:hypothetical protein
MRSVLKNKRAQVAIDKETIVYIILGLIVIVLIVNLVFFRTSWGDIIKGWIPSMNTTQGDKYSEINGSDEKVDISNNDAYRIITKELSATAGQGINYGKLAADICGVLGFGGIGDSSMYSDVFNPSVEMPEIESINLGDGVQTAVVIDSATKVTHNLIRAANGGYTLSSSTVSGSIPVSINKFGQVVDSGGKIWGSLSGSKISAVVKGGAKISSELGDDVIIAVTKSSKPLLISKSSTAFSFLSKAANVAGYVTAGVSVLCDSGAIILSSVQFTQSMIEYEDSAKTADESLARLVDAISKHYRDLNGRISVVISGGYLSPEQLSVIIGFNDDLLIREISIKEKYTEYSTNKAKQSSGTWFGDVFFKNSEFTDAEYFTIKNEIKDYLRLNEELLKYLENEVKPVIE